MVINMGNQQGKIACEPMQMQDEVTKYSPSAADLDREFIQQLLLRNPKLAPRRTSTTTFTCFTKLPLELRRMIWTYALLQPVIIDLTAFDGSDPSSFAGVLTGTSTRYIPLLHVCHESSSWIYRLYLSTPEIFTTLTLFNKKMMREQYLHLPSCGNHTLLVSQDDALGQFTWLYDFGQKGVLQPQVGVVAIDSVIVSNLIRDSKTQRYHRQFNEYYLNFLSRLTNNMKMFQNLQEVIVLSRTADTYQGLAADLEWFLREPVPDAKFKALYRHRMEFYPGPQMTKIPKITNVKYERLSGLSKVMSMKWAMFTYLQLSQTSQVL
jgi:hypothetical protein